MRLRDRLSLLSTTGAAREVELPRAPSAPSAFDTLDRAERIEQLRSLIGGVVARRPRDAEPVPHAEPQPLPVGELRDTPDGPLRVVERWLDPGHCHGRVRASAALGVDPSHVATLAQDRSMAHAPLADLLILDTETTGLAGGTGTVPFLVGLASFEAGAGADPPVLKLEQLFLENLGGEAPLLRYLHERLRRASLLVTYNGKSFDWPLLRARFVLSRLPVPELPPHLDLLHCARRMWSRRLPSVRLTEVERSILGLYREDDVDGSEIPGLYTRYLRGADPECLLPVLAHNEHDLVALAALLAELGALYAGRASHTHDQLACARLALRARDATRARAFADAAVHSSEEPGLRREALWLRARLLARQGEHLEAIASYDELLSDPGAGRDREGRAHVHLALSRLHERAGADLLRAYAHARHSEPAEGPVHHGKRLGRLLRKLLRAHEAF